MPGPGGSLNSLAPRGVLEDNVNFLAEHGIVQGDDSDGDGVNEFDCSSTVTRGQMAQFLRWNLDLMVDEGSQAIPIQEADELETDLAAYPVGVGWASSLLIRAITNACGKFR